MTTEQMKLKYVVVDMMTQMVWCDYPTHAEAVEGAREACHQNAYHKYAVCEVKAVLMGEVCVKEMWSE